jgi:hypothetical protein
MAAPKNLEEFLTNAMMEGQSVRLVPVAARDGQGVEFYAHIMDQDGDTVDYKVTKDRLLRLEHGAGG